MPPAEPTSPDSRHPDAAGLDDGLDAALGAAAAALHAAGTIVVAGHVGPDGDALGSSVGLALSARAAGKQAHATFPAPFTVPHQLRFIDTSALTPPDEVLAAPDVFVACDTAAPDRLGELVPVAEAATTTIVVDHHRSNGGFGDIAVVDPTAASTAELVFRLIRRLEWKIDQAIATALYTGVVTDTGRFMYSATGPDTHRVAAELLEAGVRPEVVGRHIYEEAPFGYLKVAGDVLSRARLEADVKLVWSVVTADDLERHGVAYEDTDGLIDLIRIAEESDVACLLKVLDRGRVKGSLRSRGRVDVAAIAAAFGGGGHHNAAGFTTEGDPEAIIARIRELL